MAGIKDVAKKAQVGVGTVSRMINDSGYVSEETRKKIEIAMKELNYTPNELARNLYHKRTGIIAVLVPNITAPFFAEFVNHVEAELYKYGYKMMLCNTEKENNAEAEYLDMLNRHIVDGIITGVHSLNVETYEKINKPIVALDRYLGEDIPVVTADHKEGGRLAAELLVKNGCRNVLHFTGSTEISSPYLERHFEFERVMRNHGINVFTYQLKLNRFDVEYYREVAKDAFSKSADYDGIFAVDELAVECMNEVIRSKKRVPEDIKIVAYDGTFIADMTEPRLTVIAQPIDSLAKESVRLLRDLMNGKSFKNKQIILDVQIRGGGTTFNS